MNLNVTEDRWQRVDDLFQRASELDPKRRQAFLKNACGEDSELRSEVEGLLESAEKTTGFLTRPVDNAVRQITLVGRRVGSYVLVRSIGEGGMGRVFLAHRADDQYRQLVAIKLMHAGQCRSETLLQRFRTERQILANLNHPNIARLLDGGVTEDGGPYLVMEYVAGTPVDKYCRKNALSVEARLNLFQMVCSAVAYAHKNLVVHRDIKPANILVGEDGSPKLLDFGIAKFMDPDDGNQLAMTKPTERLMTPEYASPEQLRGEPITTATDVYGLGVLLYEMLSEKHPFGEHLGNPAEMIRQICEVDPQPPSAVASPQGKARQLGKSKTELDQIVLMALRKEPERRYSSAARLAADVSAYLGGYPLAARSGDWRYKAQKFVRRHKLVVAAAIVLAVSLAGFSVAMAFLTRQANRERREAEVERVKAERAATFLADMFRAATPGEARGRAVTPRELLDRSADRVDSEFANEPTVQAFLLYSIADSYLRLGLYDQARELAKRSYEIRSKLLGPRDASTADSLFLLANSNRLGGNYTQAEPMFREALDIRRTKFSDDSAIVAETLSFLGECLFLEGKIVEAEAKLRQGLDIYQRHSTDAGSEARDYLARLLERKGDYLEAAHLLNDAVEIDRRTEGTDSPNYTKHLHNLGGASLRLGDLFTAEARLRESLDTERRILGNAHPDLGYSLNLLGVAALEEGDWRTAAPLLHESLSLWSSLGSSHPLAMSGLSNWGRVLQAQGKYSEARRYFQRALAIAEQSSDTYSTTRVLFNLAVLEFDSGNYRRAEELARRTLSMQKTIAGGDTAPDTALTMITLAETRVFQGDPASAEPVLRNALEILKQKLPEDYPAVTTAKIRLGEVLTAEGKAASAEPILRSALASVYAPPFRIPVWQVGEAESALGFCLVVLDHPQEARRLLQQSQNKLVSDPRPVFRLQAADHLKRVARSRQK